MDDVSERTLIFKLKIDLKMAISNKELLTVIHLKFSEILNYIGKSPSRC